MKDLQKYNNFFVGILIVVIIFLLIYSVLTLVMGFPFFSGSRQTQWTYIIPMIVNLILARFMLVKWNFEKAGRGMMFLTLLGILAIIVIVR